MRAAQKILNLYAALFALVLFGSGFINLESSNQLIFQALFAPVLIYLIYKLIRPSPKLLTANRLILAIVGLIVIIVVGMVSLPKTQNASSNRYSSQAIVANGKEKIQENQLEIMLDDSNSFLNIKNEPSKTAESVGQALPGEIYSYTEELEEWYKILLENDESGWIHGDYASLIL